MVSAVLDRDGQQLSATQTREQALADADHLALLHAICTAETTPARHQRYRELLAAALPPGYQTEPGHQAYRQPETVFAVIMADRADWDAAHRHQRHLAVAADAELRRRHPASTCRRCALPNPNPPPTPSVTSSP